MDHQQVSDSPPPWKTAGYRIQPAREADLPRLAAVERAAARQFPGRLLPPALRAGAVPLAVLREAHLEGRLWVALSPRGLPVGFAVVDTCDGDAFLVELDVHPAHQCLGLGRALVARVVQWGRAAGHAALTLTTFASLPWNAPFYARLGFQSLAPEACGPALASRLAAEARLVLRERVAMRLALR
ncbi:GNAT family N-acetyltransferase [Halomonas pacifica]|uniref:GNAT family N-acetyltransferase n=1 Tax=Bisbaumannia pacifica TaxID=77098 RepID=UPI00235A3E98|nr:GNAT family N-acetyltransferase [Halomonas pacifica]MDC8803170.1 GNAT family N-acetyltransferase [Halomonas pacifica]